MMMRSDRLPGLWHVDFELMPFSMASREYYPTVLVPLRLTKDSAFEQQQQHDCWTVKKQQGRPRRCTSRPERPRDYSRRAEG